LLTVFVNGIPSTSSLLRVVPQSGPVFLAEPAILPSGAFQFTFTNVPGAVFEAVATTTGLSLGSSNWIDLGTVTETSSGKYRFSDTQATNYLQRYYRVHSL
jgi:hypothetical protein